MYGTLGDNLRILRFTKNLTQEQVAKAIGINESTLGRYENDKVEKPRSSQLQKFADFYQVSIDDIIEKN